MARLYQKKRRFRIDTNNPYRTRYMVYNLVAQGGRHIIEVNQYDYVLRSKVAEDRYVTPEIEPGVGDQLMEHMLENAKSIGDVEIIYSQWRQGQLALINESKNVLVKEALRRRFARNLKKL